MALFSNTSSVVFADSFPSRGSLYDILTKNKKLPEASTPRLPAVYLSSIPKR